MIEDRLIYLQLSDDGQNIRKWSREPFAGATAFANAGNGAPLGRYDRSDHYPPEELPFALRSIAENIHVQCAPHVLEDMVRIVTDAAADLDVCRETLSKIAEPRGAQAMHQAADAFAEAQRLAHRTLTREI